MKNQKTIFSRLWALALAGVLVLSLGACSGDNTPAPTEAPATTAVTQAPTETTVPETVPPETEPAKAIYRVGDTVKARNFELTYLASGEQSTEWYEKPEEGNRAFFLKFSVKNLSSEPDRLFIDNFQCYADGQLVDISECAFKYRNSSAPFLSADETGIQTMVFEVPENAQEIELQFDGTQLLCFYDNDPIFLYEGELDSGLSGTESVDSTSDATNPAE